MTSFFNTGLHLIGMLIKLDHYICIFEYINSEHTYLEITGFLAISLIVE